MKRSRLLWGVALAALFAGDALAGSSDPSTVYTNQFSCSGATAAAVALPALALSNGVAVKAGGTNTGTVYVGTIGVTLSTGFPLAAGEAVRYGVTNLASTYYFCTVSGDNITVIGN